MNTLPIAMISDKNFIMPTVVAITSIVANKDKNTFLDFYILAADCKEEDLAVFEFFEKNPDVKINTIIISLDKYRDIKQISSVPIACLLKFELCDRILQYNKILYLDGDIIVRDDLLELFSCNIDDYYFGAILHPICIIDGQSRINGGVILFNAEKMRQEHMSQKLITYRRGLGTRGSMDQQTFNEVCKGKIKFLAPEYNCIPRLLIEEHYPKLYTLDEYNYFFNTNYLNWREIMMKAKLIHFNDEKPWNYRDLHFGKEWEKYYMKSPFAGVRLNRGGKVKRLKKIYHRDGISGVYERYIKGKIRKIYYWIRGIEFRKMKCPKDNWG